MGDPKQMDPWTSFVESVCRGEHPSFAEHWAAFQNAARAPSAGPPIAWWPEPAVRERSNLHAVLTELGLDDYQALHRYSVEEREAFWRLVVERLGIVFETEPERVVDLQDGVKRARWFPGAELDISRSAFAAPKERPAILYGREGQTDIDIVRYGELGSLVDRFAAGLVRHGLTPGDGVALYMPMTVECVAAYLGTVRAGCRVVSIADSFSADELVRRIDIAGARAIVTVSSYRRAGRDIDLYRKVRDAAGRARTPLTAIVVEPDGRNESDVAWDDFLGDETNAPLFAGPPDHVTNLLFSSGTTGDPKAIPWTEITPLKAAMDAHFHQDVHPEDVLCWPTNVGWMMGPWLIYAALINDATMALYGGAPTGEGFVRFVRDARVRMLGVVPSIVRAWRGAEIVERNSWPELGLFSSTGEASSAEDYLWLMSRTDYRAPVIEYLGGTEIGGGHLTGTVLQPASPATFTTPALGIDLVILDERGEPVPIGETGELYLVPPALGLSQELLNRDHDAAYYDGCPPGPGGEVLRRHGDQIARLANGYFKAQGRSDDTMNLGGIKVSSVELERVVNEHASVRESAAIAVQRESEGADELVVYVVLEPDADAAGLKEELGKAIASRLNPLFRIEDVVAVSALPRTASNKILRRELRAAYRERA